MIFMGENFSVLRAESAPDSITLYWERQQGRLGTTYEIFLKSADQAEADFTLIGSTQKTHYTIENLQANTEYEILVKGIIKLMLRLLKMEASRCRSRRKLNSRRSQCIHLIEAL